MAVDEFGKQIGAADTRAAAMREAGAGTVLIPELFEELNLSLEELRVAEEELRQQNDELGETRLRVEQERRRYQELFDFAPDAYLVTDPEGLIAEANQAAASLLGVTARRLVGKPLAAYVAPDARATFRTRLSRGLRDAAAASWHTTLRPRGRGAALPAAVSVGTVREPGGRLTGLRWLVRERRPQEAEMEALLAAAPVGMALLAPDLRYLQVNEALAAIHGLPAAEHRGRHAREVLAEPVWRTVEPLLQRALAGETIQDVEVTHELPAKEEGPRHLRLSFYPVHVGGEARAVGKSVQDITARKNAAQRQERDLAHSRHIADTLQTALMQTVSENAFPGLSLATLYKAASQEAGIGGDFYDVYTVDGGEVALVVGDVSGKGLSAATHIAEVKYTLRAFLRENPSPGHALARLNDSVCEAQRQDGWGNASLVVLALAVVDPTTGGAVYASAGAEPMLILPPGDGEVEEIGRRSGLVLGVTPGQQYLETALTLEPGAMLLMATDGITEARQGGEMLNLDGLKRLAAEARHLPEVGEISRAILDGARDHAGGILTDDACLLLARRRES